MQVFAVIPVHNHVEETLRCLAGLTRQTGVECGVFVVDGGSTDGTPERIAAAFPQVTVVRGDDSLWWTGATALGVDAALEVAGAGDFILFLNNDTEVGTDYLQKLVACSERHGRVLVGSLNVSMDTPPVVVDSGVRWDWASVSSAQLPVEAGAIDTTDVTTLSGRGMLVPVEVFQKIGNVDARRLPHYAADYEFSMRAARAGFRLAFSYEAVVRVNTTITGREGDLATPVGFGEALHLLFSRRSIRNVMDRLRFVAAACPPEYRIRNYAAVAAASAWLLTNVPILFQIKHGLLRIVLPGRLKSWMRARKLLA
ncbi:MAG: glycosyltransferase family 2 protein [Planctomycetes bacterium]|nr:glycosyltransferase family 2 protein [Planctomycetota bacterium]